MLTFKKIVAAIFMVLSVIAAIAMIIALIYSWVLKSRVETTVTQLLVAGENVTQVTREAISRVDESLDKSIGVINNVDARINEIAQGVTDNAPLFNQLLDSINIDLKSGVENAANSFLQIEANIIAINDAVDAITAIPMLGMDSRRASIAKLQEVERQMAQFREDVTAVADLIQAERAAIIDGKFSIVTGKTGSFRTNLQTARANLKEADTRLAESGQSMAQLRQRLPALLMTATILLNLFLLLAFLAFISLFLKALEYFKCPQDGLKGLLPGECAEAAISS